MTALLRLLLPVSFFGFVLTGNIAEAKSRTVSEGAIVVVAALVVAHLPPASSIVLVSSRNRETAETGLTALAQDRLRKIGYAVARSPDLSPDAHKVILSLSQLDDTNILSVQVDNLLFSRAYSQNSDGTLSPMGAFSLRKLDSQ